VPIDELIIGIIAFLIVFGGLAKFALPSIKKTLEDRTNAIEGGIERAAEAEAEAKELAKRVPGSQLAAAREEAAAIRTQAQADRTAIIDEARTEARAAAAAGAPPRAEATARCGAFAGDRPAHPAGRRAVA